MTTLRASGHRIFGSTRRAKVSAIHAMSPCDPAASQAARPSRAPGGCGGGGDATAVEAERAGARLEAAQKSRSA